MSLSRPTMRHVIAAVKADPEACYRINSSMRRLATHEAGKSVGPSSAGIVGAARNLGMGLVYGLSGGYLLDPSDQNSRGYKFSCDGIAEAASAAIKKRLDLMFEIADVGTQARIVGYNHTGVRLDMADKTQYFVDWWKSLDVLNPILFRYDDFMYNRGNSVAYQWFRGFPD